MSGALNSVFGGGNVFGALLSIASIAFPPMALATSLSNMIGQAVGQALMGAVTQLVQNGMPRFLGEAIKQMVQGILPQLTQPSDSQADEAVQSNFQSDMQDLTKDLMEAIVKNAQAIMQQDKGDGKSSSSKGTKGSVSWLEAIALAMGEAAGNKAAKMVELSNKLSKLSSAGGGEKAQQAAAKEMNAVNAQFQATAQEYNMLQTAFSTAIKAIGEGLSAMARKQ